VTATGAVQHVHIIDGVLHRPPPSQVLGEHRRCRQNSTVEIHRSRGSGVESQ
jgi:hypothetical protein